MSGRRNPLGVQLTGKCAEELARVRPVASEDPQIGAVVNAMHTSSITRKRISSSFLGIPQEP